MDINSKNVNILVTGGTSSGKTVAACCTFNHMTQGGGIAAKNGGSQVKFSLLADGSRAARIMDDFADTYIDMLEGRLPAGSMENKQYELLFKRDQKTVCNILWMDYRGALTKEDWSDPAYQEQMEEFKAMLEHSTLLIYIISGEVLRKYASLKRLSPDSVERKKEMTKVNKEIMQIRHIMEKTKEIRGSDDRTPFLFYITKSDYIEYGSDQEKFSELISLLKENALLQGDRRIVCCHSTLGRAIVLNEENRIESGFEPEGFEIPLMLSVGYAMSEEGKRWEEEEYAKLDAQIHIQRVNADISNEEKGKLMGGAYRVFGPLMKRRQELIEKLEQEKIRYQDKIGELEKKKALIESEQKAYSREILSYITDCAKDNCKYAVYVDKNGEEKPLEAFFA